MLSLAHSQLQYAASLLPGLKSKWVRKLSNQTSESSGVYLPPLSWSENLALGISHLTSRGKSWLTNGLSHSTFLAGDRASFSVFQVLMSRWGSTLPQICLPSLWMSSHAGLSLIVDFSGNSQMVLQSDGTVVPWPLTFKDSNHQPSYHVSLCSDCFSS